MPRSIVWRIAAHLAPPQAQRSMLLGVLLGACVGGAAGAAGGGAPQAGESPRQLTVREWVVERIDGRGVVDNSRSTLTFDASGQIAGGGGCNRYTGTYQLQGAGFQVRGVATTRMACTPALMEQEARFLRALGAVSTWRLQADGSLLLAGPDGRALLLAR